MDHAWMQQKLTEFRDLAEKYLRTTPRPASTLFGPVSKDRPRPDNEDLAELRRREPTVKEILKRLDPELADFNVDGIGGDKAARDAADRGLGILAERDEWAKKLAPDAPALPADQFHPWVWQAAQTLWDSGHYRHAVQAAATAINDHTQAKLSRRDVADDSLMQEAFSTNAPQVGKPRLRCPGDPSNPTVQSRQRGALQFAVGCFQAIRNPATHEQGEWDEQTALECLASFSVLARWIDGWRLETTP
jgi:uncharacterized protein (TIGR02391 family)